MVQKERKISLLGQQHQLSQAQMQIQILEFPEFSGGDLAAFDVKINETSQFPLKAKNVEILQINIGKMCNQVCEHCHVDAGPDRKEIMTREIMEFCLSALKNSPSISTVDLTGGAPEMNPEFRWFVGEIKKLNRHIIVRCNLTIILANKKYHDLPQFYKENNIEVVCSLPFYTQDRTDRQRGNHVFEKSIEALQMLNKVGYGVENSNLKLNLVYNPAGAFLPPSQISLEKEYKDALLQRFGIVFNQLFAITNLPISRFLSYLVKTENYESYMQKLVESYNSAAVQNVMCRNTISVGWDGYLYDCDFNQMLEMKVNGGSEHISDFHLENLNNRLIKTGQHCYGCTAGAGSSCGGTVA